MGLAEQIASLEAAQRQTAMMMREQQARARSLSVKEDKRSVTR
jgi:hypothetical protein